MTINEETLQVIEVAGLAVWLAGAVYFILRLRVFAPRSLKDAPARESGLSLPVIGAVILLYFVTQFVCAGALMALGVPQSLFGPPATAPASQTMSATVVGSMPAPDVPPPLPTGWRTDREVVFNIIGMGSAALTLIPVLVVIPLLFKDGWRGWGLSLRQAPKGIALGLGGFAIVYPVLLAFILGLQSVYSLFHHEMSEHPTFEALDQHGNVLRQAFLCFAAVAVAPISEEIFFRGIVQTTLVQYRMGAFVPQLMVGSRPAGFGPGAAQRWIAIALTSAFFAYVHPRDQAPIIFVLAIGLGYLYERTGNLWACIALHTVFNATMIGIYLAER